MAFPPWYSRRYQHHIGFLMIWPSHPEVSRTLRWIWGEQFQTWRNRHVTVVIFQTWLYLKIVLTKSGHCKREEDGGHPWPPLANLPRSVGGPEKQVPKAHKNCWGDPNKTGYGYGPMVILIMCPSNRPHLTWNTAYGDFRNRNTPKSSIFDQDFPV